MTRSLRVDRLVIDAPGLGGDEARVLAQLVAENLGRVWQLPGGGSAAGPQAAVTRQPGEPPGQLALRIAEHLAVRLIEAEGR